MKKSPSANAKGLEMVRLPRLVSQSMLVWDKIRISIDRVKHGKLRISLLNSDI
jgi:hypothetical protein